jgi:hypothetical protein
MAAFAVALATLSVVTTLAVRRAMTPTWIDSKVSYYAVLMSSGHVLIGHLQAMDDDHVVLTDVYYFRSQVDGNDKSVRNVLAKRGKEWHAPDRTIIKTSNVLFIEPVGDGSGVTKAIAEMKDVATTQR